MDSQNSIAVYPDWFLGTAVIVAFVHYHRWCDHWNGAQIANTNSADVAIRRRQNRVVHVAISNRTCPDGVESFRQTDRYSPESPICFRPEIYLRQESDRSSDRIWRLLALFWFGSAPAAEEWRGSRIGIVHNACRIYCLPWAICCSPPPAVCIASRMYAHRPGFLAIDFSLCAEAGTVERL